MEKFLSLIQDEAPNTYDFLVNSPYKPDFKIFNFLMENKPPPKEKFARYIVYYYFIAMIERPLIPIDDFEDNFLEPISKIRISATTLNLVRVHYPEVDKVVRMSEYRVSQYLNNGFVNPVFTVNDYLLFGSRLIDGLKLQRKMELDATTQKSLEYAQDILSKRDYLINFLNNTEEVFKIYDSLQRKESEYPEGILGNILGYAFEQRENPIWEDLSSEKPDWPVLELKTQEHGFIDTIDKVNPMSVKTLIIKKSNHINFVKEETLNEIYRFKNLETMYNLFSPILNDYGLMLDLSYNNLKIDYTRFPKLKTLVEVKSISHRDDLLEIAKIENLEKLDLKSLKNGDLEILYEIPTLRHLNINLVRDYFEYSFPGFNNSNIVIFSVGSESKASFDFSHLDGNKKLIALGMLNKKGNKLPYLPNLEILEFNGYIDQDIIDRIPFLYPRLRKLTIIPDREIEIKLRSLGRMNLEYLFLGYDYLKIIPDFEGAITPSLEELYCYMPSEQFKYLEGTNIRTLLISTKADGIKYRKIKHGEILGDILSETLPLPDVLKDLTKSYHVGIFDYEYDYLGLMPKLEILGMFNEIRGFEILYKFSKLDIKEFYFSNRQTIKNMKYLFESKEIQINHIYQYDFVDDFKI